MVYKDYEKIKWYAKQWYQKNKKKIDRKRNKKKKHIPQKYCKECGKLMKMEDYLPDKSTPSYKNRFVANWKIRKYCSEACLKNYYIKIRKGDYTRVQIRNNLREKIRRLQFGDYKTVSDVLNRLFKSPQDISDFCPKEVKLNEHPCMIKVFTEEGTTSFGGKPKCSTFYLPYQKGDELGERLRGEGSCMIIGVFSRTNGDEQNENGT